MTSPQPDQLTANLFQQPGGVAKLSGFDILTTQARLALDKLRWRHHTFSAGEDISKQGDPIPAACIVISGIACRYRTLDNGRRQILFFHIRGDAFGFSDNGFHGVGSSVGALTVCKIAYAPNSKINTAIVEHPSIAASLWRLALADAAITEEWMIGMGSRSASSRVAHLFCELVHRMRAANLAASDRCSLPLSQKVLGDAVGLSPMHVSRSLRHLRDAGLASHANGVLSIYDWPGLCLHADFEDDYLKAC